MSDKTYGATALEWDYFSLMLGLTKDMLPCVADPNAKISTLSTLKSIGKVPSRFDRKGDVVGIAKWTSLHSNEAQINQWRNHGNYSICVQTRTVRAIDIDVGDVHLGSRIRARLCQLLGLLPCRARPNSARILHAFVLDGLQEDVRKRVIRLGESGIIEFLADGQQFIAAGTHTSGSRYFWEGGLPDDFPVVEYDRFDAAWRTLAREFGVVSEHDDYGTEFDDEDTPAGGRQSEASGQHQSSKPVTPGRGSAASMAERTRRADGVDPSQQATREQAARDEREVGGAAQHDIHGQRSGGVKDRTEVQHRPPAGGMAAGPGVKRADPVAVWLKQRGWITGRSNDKVKLFVACPWEDLHTSDTGESSTAWFLAGTNGYVHGHFECLHAHCHARTDADFLAAVGFEQSMINEFSVVVGDGRPELIEGAFVSPVDTWRGDGTVGSGLSRSKKGWLATANNIVRALSTDGFWRKIARDRFRDCIMWSPWNDIGGWRPWTESDYTRARIELEKNGFEPMGKDLLRDAIRLVAESNAFDAAQDWLNGLVWDGVPRIGRFMTEVMGAEDTAYSAAVGEYMWTALAGRTLEPGVKADMVPIFVSPQGLRKTSAIEALVPSVDFYGSLDWHDKEDNILRKMRGRMVMEMAELRGLKTKEQEAIRAFITQRYDSWVPKYAELEVTIPRRVLIIGTSNDDEILSDETGNRRWLPVKVGQSDDKKIQQNRDQFWAEGAKLFKNEGIKWQTAQRLAVDVHAQFMSSDDWEEAICHFLESENEKHDSAKTLWKNSKVTTTDVLVYGLGFDLRLINQSHQRRVAKILKTLGYETRVGKDSQQKSYRYYYTSTLSTL